MTLGQDWPAAELQDVLDEYGFRILGRERRRSGPSPWRRAHPIDRTVVYDPEATWTETHYTIRWDATCVACGRRFGYSFEVDQVSRVHKAGRSTDGSLRRELGRQLRRRKRCPHCRTVQKEPRRSLLREDRRQTALGCGLILGGLVLAVGWGGLGGWVAGIAGFFVGAFLGLGAAFILWFFGFPYLLSIGPSI